MLYSHIQNITLKHNNHDDLLDDEQKDIYLFLLGYSKTITHMANKNKIVGNFIYQRLQNKDFLITYANHQLDVPCQHFIYNRTTKKLETEVDFTRLKPILDDDTKTMMRNNLVNLIKKEKGIELFPNAKEKLFLKAKQTKTIHKQSFRGWDGPDGR